MSCPSRNRRLRLALCVMTILTVHRFRSEAQIPPAPAERGQPPGSDVFVMVREALLREKPSRESRFIGKLPGGARVKLLEGGETYLKVEVAAGAVARTGYLSRDVASVFSQDEAGTRELLTLGRTLAASEPHRRLAAAFLMRASERQRASGPGDAAVEVVLGETAEMLASSGGPFPPGLEVTERLGRAGASSRWLYTGDAFRRAVAMTSAAAKEELGQVRVRAIAGALRQHYADPSESVTLLGQESAAWLELAETAQDASALRCAANRLGESSLALGRLLVVAGRLSDVEKLEPRVRAAGSRVQSLLPNETAGRKLLSRARLLLAMRGSGAGSSPQEARVRLGPKEVVARIEGKPGALTLSVLTTVGGTRDGPRKKTAVPLLPVPGSLRLSPDGRSVAWVEIAAPSKLVPVVALLEKDEPAREIAYLSSGRPLKDNVLSHVLSTLSGYSSDGQRLGLSIQAWNETPGPDARYSVVSVATGDLLFETATDMKGFRRLIQ